MWVIIVIKLQNCNAGPCRNQSIVISVAVKFVTTAGLLFDTIFYGPVLELFNISHGTSIVIRIIRGHVYHTCCCHS